MTMPTLKLQGLRAAVLAVVAVGACSCPTQPPADRSLQILDPVTGRELSILDDKDPATPGLQFEAVLQAVNLDGASVALVATSGQLAQAATGTVENGAARLAFTLSGNVTIIARATPTNGDAVDSAPVVLSRDGSTVKCAILAPADGTTLTSDADATRPGFQTDAEVRCGGLDAGATLSARVGGSLVGTGVLGGNGTATLRGLDLAEGENILVIVATDARNTASARVTVTVQTGGCRVAISPRSGTVFNARGEGDHDNVVADLVPGSPMNALVDVTHDCAGARIEVRNGSDVLGSALATISPLSVEVTLPDGDLDVRAYATGTKTGVSPQVSYRVDSVLPTVSFSTPVASNTYGPDDDASTDEGFQLEFAGVFTGVATDEFYDLVLNPGAGSEQVLRGRIGETGAFSQVLTLSPGTYDVLARAVRPLGTVASTGVLRFSIVSGLPSLAITTPTPSQALDLLGDARPGDAGFQVGVGLSSSLLGAGAVSVTCNGETVATTLDAAGSGLALVTVSTPACGANAVSCRASALRGGVTTQSDPVTFTVDAARPTVVGVVPATGSVVASAPTLQVTLACAGETVVAALTRDGIALAGPASFSDVVEFSAVPLVAGPNALQVAIADAAGNATTVDVTLTLDADPPATRFVEPVTGQLASYGTADDSDADLSNGFQRTITVAVDNEPVDTVVQLTVGGVDPLVARTVLTEAGLVATFTGVTLPEGESTLRACAVDTAGSSGCDEVVVSVDTVRPTCIVGSPLSGVTISASADANATLAGVQQNISVRSSAAADAVVRLTMTRPDASTEVLEELLVSGTAAFEVTLPADGRYAFAVLCDATSPLPGQALPLHVNFDGTAPVATLDSPSAAAVFSLASVDPSATAGFQVALRLSSSEQDGEAQAVVTCAGVPTTLGPVALAIGVAELPLLTVADVATCTIAATVRDVAGNTSAVATGSFSVDRVAPVVTVDQPVDGSLLGAAADADLGTAGFQANFIRALVTNDPGTVYVLTINGTPVTTTPTNDGSRLVWTRPTLDEGTNVIVVTGTDLAGNVTTSSATVRVDSNAPSVSIQNPIAGILTRRNDLDPATAGLQVTVTLSGSKLDNGTVVRICSAQAPAGAAACQTGSGRKLAENTLSGGAALVPAVTLPEGSIGFYAEAIDVFSNVATSATINTRVDSIPLLVTALQAFKVSGATETLLDPAAGSAVFGNTSDSDAVTPGFQVRLRATLGRLDGQPAYSVRFIGNSPAPGTPLASVNSASDGTATATVTLADANHSIYVEVGDAVGNLNSTPAAPVPGESPTTLAFAIDTAPPSVAITRPRARALLKVDDVDAATAGLQFNAEVDTDVGAGREVRFFVDGVQAATGNVAGRLATIRVTVPEGAHALTARTTDAAGNEATSASVAVTVDSIAPVVALTSPVDGATLNTDADPVAEGFQIAGPTVSYSQVEAGRTLSLKSSVGGLLATATTDAGGVATFPALTVPGGAQVLTAEVADANGNLTVSAGINVTVATSVPFIRFASSEAPFFFGLSDDTTPGGGCDLVVAATCDSNGASAVLLVNGVASAPQTVASNAVSFSGIQVAAGATVTFQLRATDTSNATGLSPTRQATCDLTAPTLSLVDPVAGGTVRYVAFGNPGNVASARADLNATDVLEANFQVQVTGAAGGTAAISGSVDGALDTADVAADTATAVTFSSVVVPTPGAQVLTFTAMDRAGNTGTATLDISVDVRPPAAVRPTVTVVDRRKTAIELSFTAPGGDATDSGPVASYVVRRSAAVIDSAGAWAAATAVTPLEHTIVAPGATQVLRVEGLPFETTYHFAVRAIDAAGNLGALPATSPDAADTFLARRRLTAPLLGSTGTLSGRMVVGDLDGDGKDDVIASAGTANGNVGLVRVHYGSSGTAVTPIDIPGPAGQTARFGTGLAVGDVNGDGQADLVVGAQNQDDPDTAGTTTDGAVHIFLGRPNVRLTAASVADAVIFGRLPAAGTSGMGTTVAVVKDLNGDAIDDIAVSALAESGGAGRGVGVVHLFAGRATWPATLTRSAALLATLTSPLITSPATGPRFGQTIVSLGDLGGASSGATTLDARGEFAVGQPAGTLAAAAPRPVYVVSGRLVALRAAELVAASAAPVIAVETLAVAVNSPALTNAQWGIGLAAGDVTGDDLSDLAIADIVGTVAPATRVELFSGAALAALLPTAVGTGATLSGDPMVRLVLPDAPNAPLQVSFVRDITGDGLGEIAATRSGPSNLDEVYFWRGRSVANWATAGATPEVKVLRRPADEGGGYGFTVRGAFYSGAARRDLVIHDLNGGISVLSDP